MSSQKNETAFLMSTLLITAGLLAGGFWWLTRKSVADFGKGVDSQPNNAPNSSLSLPSSAPLNQRSNTSNFASIQDVPTGLFNYGGSTSWAPIRLVIDPQMQAAHPTFRLRFVEPTGVAPGSSSGIRMLIEGKLAFAQSSRPLLDREVSRAAVRGFGLKPIPVAIDGLAIAVHPSLNIPGLTLAQLRAIYTNKVTNWKQLGGPDLPIKPYSRPISDGGTVELFVQDILVGQPIGGHVEFVATTTQALQKIAGNPGGIYYASAPEVVPQCSIRPLPLGRQVGKFVPPYQEPQVPHSQCPNRRNQLNVEAFRSGQYPITRNLFVVVKQNSQSEQQAGEAYANLLLTEEGQAQITQAGFVRIK